MSVTALDDSVPQPRAAHGTETHAENQTMADPLFAVLVRYANLPPDDPERARLRGQLVTGYQPLAQRIAGRFAHRGEPLEDLVQVATIGLINAIDRYDPELGDSFYSFAVPTIRGEVRRYFRDRGWSMRVSRRLKELHLTLNHTVAELSQRLGRPPRPSEIAHHLDLPIDEIMEGLRAGEVYRASSLDTALSPRHGEDSATLADQLGTLDPQLELIEDHHALRPLLHQLPERERGILMLRFYGNMTQTEIAEHIGISQMHVSRLLSHTLARLREQLRAEAPPTSQTSSAPTPTQLSE
jgi:RNA polymerase sigma-B factor